MTSAIDTTGGASSRWRSAPTIAEAQSGQKLIGLGSKGESVSQIQQALVARGHHLAVDGAFGPDTDRAVRAFQRSQQLDVDGIVGPDTLRRLEATAAPGEQPFRREGVASAPTLRRDTTPLPGTVRAGDLARADDLRRNRGTTALAPANATPEERYRHYAEIVRRNGGEVNPGGKPTVLGLRGLSRDGVHDTGSTRAYDDTFVVLQPNGTAYEFRGATHPGQLRSTLAPDVSGDRVGDVGMMNPGNYVAVPNGDHNGAASYHVTRPSGNGHLPGVRDTNGDGRFTDAERDASAARRDTVSAILFHQGYSDRPKSIGCQTLAPREYARFMEALGGRTASFNYTLVDAYR